MEARRWRDSRSVARCAARQRGPALPGDAILYGGSGKAEPPACTRRLIHIDPVILEKFTQ